MLDPGKVNSSLKAPRFLEKFTNSALWLGLCWAALVCFPSRRAFFSLFLFRAATAHVIMRGEIRLLGVLTLDLAGRVTQLLVCIARLAVLAGYPFSVALT